MRERFLALRPWLLRLVGYPLFFLAFFLLFLYVTFPYERLKEAIIAAADAPTVTPLGTRPSTLELSIDRLGPTVLPGLRFRGVELTTLPSRPGERASTTRLEEVVVHVSLFGLLARRASVSFEVQGMGGSAEGRVLASLQPEAGVSPLRELRVELKDLRMGELSPLVSAVGLPLGGTMSGTVELTVPDGQVNQAEGEVRLTAERMTVGDGRAQYQIPHFGGVTIDQIRAGRLEFALLIRRGQAQVQRVQAHSEEFDFQMDGAVGLRPVFGNSTINLGVRFRLTDVYRNKSERAGTIMTLLDTVPDLRAARRPDGLIAFRCTGTLERGPRCNPEGARGAPGGFGGLSAPAAGGFGAVMPPGFAP